MHYVAIVGTQVMAVLNPMLALMRQEDVPRPERVTLLTTDYTSRQSERILAYLLESELFPPDNIRIVPISDTLSEDAQGRPAAPQVLRRLQAEGAICFNMAGGMNWQVAACMQAVDFGRCFFIYPEATCIHVLKSEEGLPLHSTLPLPPPLALLKLMDVQGVRWEVESGYKPSPLLKDALTRSKISPPPDALQGVRFTDKDAEGRKREVTFDLVINRGNFLRFLMVIPVAGKNRESARKIMTLANARSMFGQLYDREIHVLTDSEEIAERLKLEEGNKTRVIRIAGGNDFFKIPFARFFSASPSALYAGKPPEHFDTGKMSTSPVVLYTAVGTNLTPTLTALWSHQPRIARLLYTPDDEKVLRSTAALARYAKHLPANRVEFLPVSHSAVEVFRIPPPEPENRFEVNVTPGTKNQGAMLNLWAGMHGGKSFSINRTAGRIEELGGSGAVKSVRAPRPADFLLLDGIALKCEGKSKVNSKANAALYRFLGALVAGDEARATLASFPEQPVKASDELSYEPNRKTGRGTIKGAGGEVLAEFSSQDAKGSRQGFWFEDVVGYALEKSGARSIQLNIKTAWSPEMERTIRQRFKRETPMSEMDVVAWYGGEYHVFSCKTSENESSTKNAEEAEFFASLFGRTAVPYLVRMRYWGEPYRVGATCVLGLRTLVDPDALQSLLRKELTERQTTGRNRASEKKEEVGQPQ